MSTTTHHFRDNDNENHHNKHEEEDEETEQQHDGNTDDNSPESDLRILYEEMKALQTEEMSLRKTLGVIRKSKQEISASIEKWMTLSNTQCLGIHGTPDTLELIETEKLESLNKDAIIRKIMTFYAEAGSTEAFRSLMPVDQAQAVIHAIYTERLCTTVKRLKLKTDKNVQKVQNVIDTAMQKQHRSGAAADAASKKVRSKRQ